LAERRRAVYRLVISPERAQGLDLRRLTVAVVNRLEQELGAGGLKWMAAIHRNTAHPHVHLVLAGMRESEGSFSRVDVSKLRLAAMKEALALEIELQRGERRPLLRPNRATPSTVIGGNTYKEPALTLVTTPALIRTPPMTAPAAAASTGDHPRSVPTAVLPSILRLRAVARRYQRQMQRDAESGARRLGWERAA
jgi:hypothetical protein